MFICLAGLELASNQINAVAKTALILAESEKLSTNAHANASLSCSRNAPEYATSYCLIVSSNQTCSIVIHIIFVRVVKSFHGLFDVLRRLSSIS